ncbi:hypothetical protein Slin15195_G108710 [Septoria linicola]|uniref:DUF6604 domain-containing protein n=1 Tax=Septoria linicola TaxID=215465 RepID=A0A9Q9B556_9PEZI|nr:hypothetical protein Slin14017_G107010 [Septoria linicola]USW57552.1 hypothetical protein Slin15195_G108710 [Septoria linicola]
MHKNANIEACVGLERLDDEAELQLRYWCLLQDFQAISDNLLTGWESTRQGRNSMLVSATTTDAAYALMRQVEQALLAAYPRYFDWSTLAAALSLRTEASGFLFHEEELRIKLLHPSAATLLMNIREKVLDSRSNPQKQTDQAVVLDESCYDFGGILRAQTQNLVRVPGREMERNGSWTLKRFSEYNKGLLRFIKTGKLSLWLVYATYIECTTYELLGEQAKHASQLYLDKAYDMRMQLGSVLIKDRGRKCSSITDMRTEYLYRDDLKYELRLPISGLILQSTTESSLKPRKARPGAALANVRGTPTAAMNDLLIALLVNYKVVCKYANENAAILAIAHLY